MMRSFFQYLLARVGLWKPEVGVKYRWGEKFVADPFKPEEKEHQIVVLEIRDGFVLYRNLQPYVSMSTQSVVGFAACWVKMRGQA